MAWVFGKKRYRSQKSRFDPARVPIFVNPWFGLSRRWVILLLVGPSAVAGAGALFRDEPVIEAVTIVGTARVVDGDTLRINGQRIRLSGINAPESDQQCTNKSGSWWRCGEYATRALIDKIAGQTVSCARQGHDRYGRMLGACTVDGEDLNGWMVRQGWAVAYTRYSHRYLWDEVVAQFARRGIWSGDFLEPEKWRQINRH